MRRAWGRRGRTPLIATAQRAPITQEHLPALIDRGHDQVRAPVVLVWDNSSSHTTGWVRRELAGRPWLSIVRLPTYAPELNPVETLWWGMKTFLGGLVPVPYQVQPRR